MKKGKGKIESLQVGQQPEISGPSEMEFPQIPDDIRTFLNESGIAEKGYTVYVYRCGARIGAGQKVRSFVNQYDNFLPTFKEIGEEYGAGNYELYIRWYDVEGKSANRKVVMNLDSTFDQVKAQRDREKKAVADRDQGNQGRGDPGGGAAAAMMQGVMMIKALSEAVAPILRPLIAGKANQEVQPDNFSNTMATLQQMGSNMLMDNFKQGLNMQRELMANMPTMDGGREDTALEKMLSALDKLIPLFTSLSDKQIRPIAQTAADQSDEIKALLSDPARLQVTYAKLCDKYGKESANRIMKAFGVREIHTLKESGEFDPGGNGKGASNQERPVDGGLQAPRSKRALKAATVP